MNAIKAWTPRRKLIVGCSAAVLAVGIAVGGTFAGQAIATQTAYTAAVEAHDAAETRADRAQADRERAFATRSESRTAAEQSAADLRAFLDQTASLTADAERAALLTDIEALEYTIASTPQGGGGGVAVAVAVAEASSDSPAEYIQRSESLLATEKELKAHTKHLTGETKALEDSVATTAMSRDAVLGTLTSQADAVIAAHPKATPVAAQIYRDAVATPVNADLVAVRAAYDRVVAEHTAAVEAERVAAEEAARKEAERNDTGRTDGPRGGGNPGTGGSNPGAGESNPGTGGSNPGTGGSNPGAGGSNPGAGGGSPGGWQPAKLATSSTSCFASANNSHSAPYGSTIFYPFDAAWNSGAVDTGSGWKVSWSC